MKRELKNFLDDVERYADGYRMLDCTAVIVGYSGGADSSLLLCILHELSKKRGFSLYAAHINHMLRGDEADGDEEFCRRTCQSLDIPFYSKRVDIRALAKEEGKSEELCAREVRYAYFEEIKRELESRGERVYIATAHNATDNAETLLFNLTRGCSSSGASGIPPVRDGYIVRPILFLSKSEVEECCGYLGIDFVTDRTNADTLYTRNKIRHGVLPTLREINPSLEATMLRTCESIRRESEYLDREAERIYKSVYIGGRLSKEALSCADEVMLCRVLCRFFEDNGAGYENVHIKACADGIRRGGDFSISLIGKKRFVCEGDLLFVEDDTRMKKEPALWQIQLSEGENILPDGARIYLFSKKEDADRIKTQNVYKLFIQQTLSGGTISNVFSARQRREGDTISSGGHTHKIKKLLSDKKIPLREREYLPIVERDGTPVWIPGVRTADGEGKSGENNIYAIYAKQ